MEQDYTCYNDKTLSMRQYIEILQSIPKVQQQQSLWQDLDLAWFINSQT